MKTCSLLLALALSASPAAAQDPADAIKELAGKLSKDGTSGRLAEAMATDAGVQAVQEKIDFLLSSRIARLERDASGCFEDYLFSTDAAGDLVLRPERKPEFDALRRRLPGALKAMAGFNRRADEIVRRLGDANPMDHLAKTAWNDSGFRAAFFHRHPAELRELDDAELLDAQGFRGLERAPDGRFRVAGPYAQELRDRMASLFELLEAVKPYEKSYLKLVATVPDAAARATLSSDLAALFLVGRVIRQANEGSQTPIGSVSEADEDKKIEASVAFTVDVAEYAPAVKECEAAVAALKASLDTLATEVAAGATDETNLIGFIRNERPRVLLAERMMAARDEQRGKADEIMASTLEEDFTANGERLTVKKGKYVDDDGAESADALKAAIETVREEFAGTIREDFDRIAERCVDSEVIGVLENRPGTYLLMDFRDRVLDRLVHDVRRQGLAVFIRAYLVKQGEEYSVRPDRTVRVEALLKRAEAIRKEQEK